MICRRSRSLSIKSRSLRTIASSVQSFAFGLSIRTTSQRSIETSKEFPRVPSEIPIAIRATKRGQDVLAAGYVQYHFRSDLILTHAANLSGLSLESRRTPRISRRTHRECAQPPSSERITRTANETHSKRGGRSAYVFSGVY